MYNARFTDDEQCTQTFALDKMIHDVSTHVFHLRVELEQSMIVTECHSAVDSQRLADSRVLFLFLCQSSQMEIQSCSDTCESSARYRGRRNRPLKFRP